MSNSLKKPRKEESGAQLLARLSDHADLSCIDPYVFSKATSSILSTSLASSCSSPGEIIEVYGTEGVGKTEMVLHYIAKACLPCSWKKHSLNGLGAKVIFIDTEFKFSVLRFATVLEKQVMDTNERLNQQFSGTCETSSSNTNFSSVLNDKTGFPLENVYTCKKDMTSPLVDCTTDISQNNASIKCMDSGGYEIKVNMSGGCSATANKSNDCCKDKTMDCRGNELETQHGIITPLTAQDVEDIVQDALGRVQVMQVLSSSQLLISLLSLENTLSNDPTISLIVIDTVSAFYWVDKLEDLENQRCTDSKMSPIASVISKYVSEFGITFLVTKSALIGNKCSWNKEKDISKKGCSSSSGAQSLSEMVNMKGKELHEHVEFLGKSWSRLNKKRLVLTRSVDVLGRVCCVAFCSDWSECRKYVCTDNGFKFL